MIDPELKAYLEQMEARHNAGMQQLNTSMQQMEARLNLLIESVRQGLGREIHDVAARVGRIEARLDRVETRLTDMQQQLVGMNHSLDRSDREASEFAVAQRATQRAQQKAIDDLVARVTRLEGKERTN
jgi:chromosome segregation ATPase